MNQIICRMLLETTNNYTIIAGGGKSECPDKSIPISSNFSDLLNEITEKSIFLSVKTDEINSVNLDFTNMNRSFRVISITGEKSETNIFIENKNVSIAENVSIVNCMIKLSENTIPCFHLFLRNSTFSENNRFKLSSDMMSLDVDLCPIDDVEIKFLSYLYISHTCYKPKKVSVINYESSNAVISDLPKTCNVYFMGHGLHIDECYGNGNRLKLESQINIAVSIRINRTNATSVRLYHSFVSQKVSNIQLSFYSISIVNYNFLPSVWEGCALNLIDFKLYEATYFVINCYYIPAIIKAYKTAMVRIKASNKDTVIESLDFGCNASITCNSQITFYSLHFSSDATLTSDESLVVYGIRIEESCHNVVIDTQELILLRSLYIYDCRFFTNRLIINDSSVSINMYGKYEAGIIECDQFSYSEGMFNMKLVYSNKYTEFKEDCFCVFRVNNGTLADKINTDGWEQYILVNGTYHICTMEVRHNELLIHNKKIEESKAYTEICIVKSRNDTSMCSPNYHIYTHDEIHLLETLTYQTIVKIEICDDISPQYTLKIPENKTIAIKGNNQKHFVSFTMSTKYFNQVRLSGVNVSFVGTDFIYCKLVQLDNSNLNCISNLTADIVVLTKLYSNRIGVPIYTDFYSIAEYQRIEGASITDDGIVLNEEYMFPFNQEKKFVMKIPLKINGQFKLLVDSNNTGSLCFNNEQISMTPDLHFYSRKPIHSFSMVSFTYTNFYSTFIPLNLEARGEIYFKFNESVTVNVETIAFVSECMMSCKYPVVINAHMIELRNDSSLHLVNITINTKTLLINSTGTQINSNINVEDNIIIGSSAQTSIDFLPQQSNKPIYINITYSMGNVPYVYLGSLLESRNVKGDNNNDKSDLVNIHMNNCGSSSQLFIDEGWSGFTLDVLCFKNISSLNFNTEWHSEEWKFNGTDRYFDLTRHGNCLSIARRNMAINDSDDKEANDESRLLFITLISVASVLVVMIPIIVVIRYLAKKKKIAKFYSDEISTTLAPVT